MGNLFNINPPSTQDEEKDTPESAFGIILANDLHLTSTSLTVHRKTGL
jgi:hypothetical protein